MIEYWNCSEVLQKNWKGSVWETGFPSLDSICPYGRSAGDKGNGRVVPKRPGIHRYPKRLWTDHPLSSEGEVAGEQKPTLASVMGRWAEAKLCDPTELTSAHKVNTPHTPHSNGVMGEKEARWIWLATEGTRAAHTPIHYGMRPSSD